MKILIAILLSSPFIFSQNEWSKIEVNEVFNALANFENKIEFTESYSLTTSIKIYSDIKDNVPYQSYDILSICKNGKEINIFDNEKFMIQNESINISIDTVNKKIFYNHPNTSYFKRKDNEDLKEYLKLAKSTFKKINSRETTYRVLFKEEYPIKEIEYTYNEIGDINKIKLVSNHTESETDDDSKWIQPTIVMEFNYIAKGKSVDLNNFINANDIVNKKRNALFTEEQLKKFEIIELRK